MGIRTTEECFSGPRLGGTVLGPQSRQAGSELSSPAAWFPFSQCSFKGLTHFGFGIKPGLWPGPPYKTGRLSFYICLMETVTPVCNTVLAEFNASNSRDDCWMGQLGRRLCLEQGTKRAERVLEPAGSLSRGHRKQGSG